jgi:hypothetical protein
VFGKLLGIKHKLLQNNKKSDADKTRGDKFGVEIPDAENIAEGGGYDQKAQNMKLPLP